MMFVRMPHPVLSLLDIDFYKLTMLQFIFHRHTDISVRFAFKNRTAGISLADMIPEKLLRESLEHSATLRFHDDEIEFLRESHYIPRGLFNEDFLNFLHAFKLGPFELERRGNTYHFEAIGGWLESTLWETIMLSTITEFSSQAQVMRQGLDAENLAAEGDERLTNKIIRLKAIPRANIVEFGTRRRFSRGWQRHVVRRLNEEAPDNLLGTSNVHLARKLGIRPIGTFAHEMPMVYSRIFGVGPDAILGSHNQLLRDWWDEYGKPLSIALTDTYGSDFFFHDFTPEQARQWKGLRQDSGSPFTFGERAIQFYQSVDIDPLKKLIIFSDGLDIDLVEQLYERFESRIQVAFGWGTNLTNDLGLSSLSLVVKAVESCGRGTVKLSDNLAKAMGSEVDIALFKRIFGHNETFNEKCRY